MHLRADDGMPFGPVEAKDCKDLSEFARRHGVDIDAEMKSVYENRDTKALGRVFQIAGLFSKFDHLSRGYGQLIYSSLLTMGEVKEFDYAAVVASEKPEIRQRIQDFLYYPFLAPLLALPAKARGNAERDIRRQFAAFFPPDYEFGKNDPIFGAP